VIFLLAELPCVIEIVKFAAGNINRPALDRFFQRQFLQGISNMLSIQGQPAAGNRQLSLSENLAGGSPDKLNGNRRNILVFHSAPEGRPYQFMRGNFAVRLLGKNGGHYMRQHIRRFVDIRGSQTMRP
jgi:hypothetical protein